MEDWRAVPGYEGTYQVSSEGRVRSLPRPRAAGGVIGVWRGGRGYAYVTLSQNGVRKNRPLHVLVARAFLGPRQPGMEVRHLDGDRMNGRLDNLVYGTPVENTADKIRHGTYKPPPRLCGEANPYSKLTAVQVREIRELNQTMSAHHISKTLGIPRQTVRNITERGAWAHA